MSFLSFSYPKNPAVAGFFFCSRMMATLLLGILSLSVMAVEPYSATYQIDADGMSFGKLERSLTKEADGSFSLRTKTYTTGFWAMFVKDRVTEVSNFSVVDEKLIPKSYHHTKKKKGGTTEEKVRFDNSKKMISSKSSEGQQNFPYSGFELDKLVYQYKIRELLKQGENQFEFSIIDRTRLRSYQFKVDELQSIDTPLGEIEALKVDWTNEEKRKTTMWFAPSLDYLLIKIVQDSGDHSFSSTIVSTSLFTGTAANYWD